METKTSLARAIGNIISTRTGIAAFADEAANRQYTFPCVDVAVESSDESVLGIGGNHDTYTKDEDGIPDKFQKRFKAVSIIRLTAKAKKTEDGSSETECVNVLETIRNDIRDIVYGDTVVQFVDPKTEEDLGVHRIKAGSISEPVLDQSGEPILHEATLKLEVHHRFVYERDVENYIKTVAVQHEVMIDGT